MGRSFVLNLDGLREIKLPTAIQVTKRGVYRLPSLSEAFSMTLGALATLGRSSGVQTANAELDGHLVALAVIEDAQFGEDSNGNTTLKELTQKE
jgi:hypothetical protein